MKAFLVAMGIEKVFDSLDHHFLISTLEKCSFGKTLMLWVKVLLRDQERALCYKHLHSFKIYLTWKSGHSR